MTRRYYANFAPQQTTAGSLTTGALSLTIAGSFTGWPSSFPFFGTLELGTGNDEIVSVTNIVGTVATIVRAQDGSTAQSHPAGVTFDFTVVRQDYDESNVHINATTGVHGLAGAPVGTTDVQTLTNKTLTTPTLNTPTASGGTTSNGSHTGDATHPALVGQATSAGGKTLSLRNSAAAEKLSVDDAGNLTTTGSLTPATVAATGAVSGASVTATAAVSGATVSATGAVSGATVAGIFKPTSYTTESVRDAAIPSPVKGMIVELTAPLSTNALPGLYQYGDTQGTTAWFSVSEPTWARQQITSTVTPSGQGTPILVNASATTASGTIVPTGPCTIEVDCCQGILLGAAGVGNTISGFVNIIINGVTVRSLRWSNHAGNIGGDFGKAGNGRLYLPNSAGATIPWSIQVTNDAGSSGGMNATDVSYAVRELR